MVERFARIEHFVDRSLVACASAGIAPANAYMEMLPLKRIEALLKSLGSKVLAPSAVHSIETLEDIKAVWPQRNVLCHGRMRILKSSVRFDWKPHGKFGENVDPLRLTALEMLEALSDLDRAQSVLGCRLGAINKICASLNAS